MKKKNYIRQDKDIPDKVSEDQKKMTGRKNPFKVPEHYFEGLPVQIQNKIKAGEPVKQKNTGLIKTFAYSGIAAAAIIIILLVFSELIPEKTQENKQQYIGNNFESTITEYLEDNMDESALIEMSSDSVSLFSPEEIPDISLTGDHDARAQAADKEFKMDASITENDIIEYFISENIDPETIL
ncbi:MAG TPA: hypothetical protein PKN48_11700 [Bacteroidales bacterium]|nr:hypothetical protein [Bacteroidales bacterium]